MCGVPVSRLVCKSTTYDVNMRIDVATDVYPMKEGQKFRMALAQTLRLDGKPDDGAYEQSGEVCWMLVLGRCE